MFWNSNPGSWTLKRNYIPNYTPKIGIVTGFIMVLLSMYGLTCHTLAVLAAPNPSDEFIIKVVDFQGGEVGGPDQTVVTGSGIYIPPDQPITLRVSHLYSKIDPISTHPHTIWVETDSSGLYGDSCAASCGLQPGRMSFGTVTTSEEISSKEQQCQPAAIPAHADAPDNL